MAQIIRQFCCDLKPHITDLPGLKIQPIPIITWAIFDSEYNLIQIISHPAVYVAES